jgi:Radical SAM superfamily
MGEPLLNPLLFQFIKYISDEADTSFASNGSALTEQNVLKLIEAGLDTVYVSFNGDEPKVFAQMMGGLSYEKIVSNVRKAVDLSNGTRLKLRSNVSITKANQDRVTRLKEQLEGEQLGPVTFSLCHNRGGNLRDRSVCDTPPMEIEHWECDVMKNTLFVDWQGKAHICDHDLHGHYLLGDLISEPLELVLRRRQELLDDSSALKICKGCNDIMRVGGAFPLQSQAGGTFRDWIYYLYQDLDDPLSEANEPMKWIFKIYQNENRVDRFANRLLEIEKRTHADLMLERTERLALGADRDRIARECDRIAGERDAIARERDVLAQLRTCEVREKDALAASARLIQTMLDERDQQFASLHLAYVAIRRDWAWRIIQMIRNDLSRICRAFKLSRP